MQPAFRWGITCTVFSTKEKSDQLLAQMPYLDVAVVTRQAPGTVIIRVQPAVERFKMEYSGSWLVLSEQLKVLRVEPAEPDNLVQLDALLPEGAATTPGSFLTLDAPSEPTALATAMPSGTATPENADEADTAQETPNEVLNELLGELDQYGLLDGTTVLTMQNMTELSFFVSGPCVGPAGHGKQSGLQDPVCRLYHSGYRWRWPGKQ